VLASRNSCSIAKQFCRRDLELKIVALRLSNVMQPEDYAEFPSFDANSRLRKWHLWTFAVYPLEREEFTT
jgi:hypothetical protein